MKKVCKSLIFLSVLPLISCSLPKIETVKVVIEDGDFKCAKNIITQEKGTDFTFQITLNINQTILDSTYKNFSITEELYENSKIRIENITFHEVSYSTLVTLTIGEVAKIRYQNELDYFDEYISKNHNRINTSIDFGKFDKEGYALVGWKNGDEIISLGSRVTPKENLILEPLYMIEDSKSDYEYKIDGNRVTITKYKGNSDIIVIPSIIEGKNVTTINTDAFKDLNINTFVLPKTLGIIANSGITNCQIETLIFYDNLVEVNDNSFNGSKIKNIRINSLNNPSFIRSYFGTYSDKVDRLIELKDKKKIILYSGSSTRFGYDSKYIDDMFLDYEVANLGVFAYTNSLPQIEVISHFINEGDILVVSPEFDSLDKQIDLKYEFDEAFFAMIEANYDILKYLDCSKNVGFFDSYAKYQYNRRNLEKYNYSETPSNYDEDQRRVNSPSYNKYGDYVVYRENNVEGKFFGVKRAFYNKIYFPIESINSFNNAFEPIKSKNVKIYFDYSPRMNKSISEDSNVDSIVELGKYLETNIKMEFLGPIQKSLMDPLYFHGTDNHLSTEGVKIRTEEFVSNLLLATQN